MTQKGGEDQQQHEKTGGFVVENQAEEEEVGVAERLFCAVTFGFGDNQGEEYVYNEEERPEMDLGEQQRMVAIEREKVSEVLEQITHRCSFFLLR